MCVSEVRYLGDGKLLAQSEEAAVQEPRPVHSYRPLCKHAVLLLSIDVFIVCDLGKSTLYFYET